MVKWQERKTTIPERIPGWLTAARSNRDERGARSARAWDPALLIDTKPGRRNRRTVDAVFLLVAAIRDRADRHHHILDPGHRHGRRARPDDALRLGGCALAREVSVTISALEPFVDALPLPRRLVAHEHETSCDARDGIEHHYEHEGRFVTALTFGELMESQLGPLGIDFDQIEGSWLGLAYASMGHAVE